MVRSLLVISSLTFVFGAPTEVSEPAFALTEEERRRSAHLFEMHHDTVLNIAVASAFDFRDCARNLDVWSTPIQKMFAGVFAGAMQGILMNFEADRRRFGFHTSDFLTNVVATLDEECADPADYVQACVDKGAELITANSEASKAEFDSNNIFAMFGLSGGVDDLIGCAISGLDDVCDLWFEEYCVEPETVPEEAETVPEEAEAEPEN